MAKVMVTYESKYGNTRLVAEAIAGGMSQVSGIETVLRELGEVDPGQLADFDIILIGSPNHIGGATRGIRKFIDRLGKLDLKGKRVAVFDTYMGGDYEKAVKKTEKQLGKKAPDLKLATPGLSLKVEGMKGPLSAGERAKCEEFGGKIAALISQ